MTLTVGPLALTVRAIAAKVEVSADRCTAVVAGRRIADDTPRDLQKRLAAALYDMFHIGKPEPTDVRPRRLRDAGLERLLLLAVPHQRIEVQALRHPDPPGVPGDGAVLVERDGVLFWAPRELIRRAATSNQPGDALTLQVPPWRPALSPGFFMVDGSQGLPAEGTLLRVYVHLTDPAGAPATWRAVLEKLEGDGASYRAKVLSAPPLYPRRDALVVYLAPASWHLAHGLAALVSELPGVAADTSWFADRLAPGVASGWEPADPRPGLQGMSFGQHRASVLARALLETTVHGGPTEESIADALATANIDPRALARNLDSPVLGETQHLGTNQSVSTTRQ